MLAVIPVIFIFQMLLKEVEKIIVKPKRASSKALPPLFFFTNRHAFENIFELIKNFPNSKVAIIVREYDLSKEERKKFAKKILQIAKPKSLPVLIAKDQNLALELGADGAHFSDLPPPLGTDIYRFRNIHTKSHPLGTGIYRFRNVHKSLPKNFLTTCSIHHPKNLKLAQTQNFNAIFYSPIFKTQSHPTQKPTGVLALAKIALKSKIPLYALGGINKSNIARLKNTKISGIAGISIFNEFQNAKN